MEMIAKIAMIMPHLTQEAAFWGALQAPMPLMPAINWITEATVTRMELA